MAIGELAGRLSEYSTLNALNDSQRHRWLKQRLESVNQESLLRGERPPFLFSISGEVTLSEFAQDESLLQLERECLELQKSHRSMITDRLLKRLKVVDLDSFKAMLLSYLERSAFHSLESLNKRDDDRIAILAQHDQLGSTLIVAHRSEEPMTNAQLDQLSRGLSALNVERGEVIHFGGFEAIEDERNNLKLIDAMRLTDLFTELEIGVGRFHTPQYYLDPSWFDLPSD